MLRMVTNTRDTNEIRCFIFSSDRFGKCLPLALHTSCGWIISFGPPQERNW
jgi:hypothetical protein